MAVSKQSNATVLYIIVLQRLGDDSQNVNPLKSEDDKLWTGKQTKCRL